MKKFVIGGAAVLTTAGIGLGLTQLANADPSSPKPTENRRAPNRAAPRMGNTAARAAA